MAVCFGMTAANAQITTGESSSHVIRTGNRAQAGNFGIYLGATSDIFKNIGDDGPSSFSAIPLINLKYMKTDQLEYRLGIEWWKKTNSSEMPMPTGDYNEETGEMDTKTVEQSTSKSHFMFYPGVAYHFSNKNLLDVYVGGELPFGWGRHCVDYDGEDESTGNFRIGLGAFIGLQAYIGNLPVAVGVEYGLSTMYSTVGDGTMTKDGMTIDYNAGIQKDYSESKWELGHQLRATVSYYFNL